MNRYLVTGGLGFIGSHFVRQVLREGNRVLNVDLETYAGDERRLADVADDHMLVRADVTDEAVAELMRGQEPDVVVHFAAETHVTRSESDAERFFHANVEGTRRMLEAAERADVGLFVHVSTDEVYGPCYGEPFKEDDK